MTMSESDKIPFQYVIFPKHLASDFKSGKLTPNEWKLCMWLRLNMNPYGITSTGVSAIQDDIFVGVSKNYIEKLLLSLRSKRYLYFEDRQGRRGSFEVRFGELITPDGTILSIKHYFDGKEVISENQTKPAENTQVDNKLRDGSHKLMEQKEQLVKRFSINSDSHQVRSSYNEHDTEHQIENHDNTLKKSFKGTSVRDFQPTDSEEERCKEIAEKVGEEYINPLRSVLRKNGFWVIEKAWGLFREAKQNGKVIGKPAAYFYGIIKKLLNE